MLRARLHSLLDHLWVRAGVALPEARREPLARALADARSKRDAATTLALHGSLAEATELARRAVALALEAAETAEVTVEERVVTLARSADTYDRLIAAHSALEASLAPIAVTERQRHLTRLFRVAHALVIVAGLLGGYAWFAKRPRGVHCVASARYDFNHDATDACDGNDVTEWLLPDRTAGYLDVELARPRTIRFVRVLNSTNRPTPDRSTNEFDIELFDADGRSLKVFSSTFGPFDQYPRWQRIPLGRVDGVLRVRFRVKTWWGLSGGLADIRLE